MRFVSDEGSRIRYSTVFEMRYRVILSIGGVLIACSSERPDFGKVQSSDDFESRDKVTDGGLDSSTASLMSTPDASTSDANSCKTLEPSTAVNPESSSSDSNQTIDSGPATDDASERYPDGSSITSDGGDSVGDSGSSPSSESGKTDSGAESDDSGTEDASKTGSWCDTQTPSVSVATADFQCLDFETEVPSAVWVSSVTGGATLEATGQRAFSLPTSLQASVPTTATFSDRGVSTLTWTNVGPTAVSGARLAMRVNPVGLSSGAPLWTGSVSLACVKYGSGEVCLRYTRSETTTGLFLRWIFSGGAAVTDECPVGERLNFELWNDLELSIDADDRIKLLVNGADATVGCTGNFGTGTVASFSIGLQSYQVTSETWTVYFDDVVAETRR